MEYIEENTLNKLEQDKVWKLIESMRSSGLSGDGKLESVTMGEINCIHGEEISQHGIKMLQQKFGIQRECTSLNPGIYYHF